MEWLRLAVLLSVCVLHMTSGTAINVAQGKPTWMSSQSLNFPASRAVDGVTRADSDEYIVHTATDQKPVWCKVDLQTPIQSANVTLYFRTNYKARRNGVQLYTSGTNSSDPKEGSLCHTVRGRPNGTDILDVLNVTCTGTWRYLTVYTETDNDGHGPILDFAEVQVWKCTEGNYGQTCSQKCTDRNCKDNRSCDNVAGMCVGGCQTGWDGTDCTQKCNDSYGDGCVYQCSARNCIGVSTCDHVTGNCEDGCNAGWKGVDCTQVCGIGSFGGNCSEECGQCLNARHCHHINGICLTGCMDGWTHHTCTQNQVEEPPNAGVLVGVVVAIVVVAAVIVIVVCFVRRRRSQIAKDAAKREDMSLELTDSKNDPECGSAVDSDDYVNPVYAGGGVADNNDPVCVSAVDSDEYLDPVCAGAVVTDMKNDPECAGAVEVDEAAVDKDNDTYYNMATAPAITLVSVDKLQERIQELQVPAVGFLAEYQKLSTAFTRPYKDSRLPENKGKNRFTNYYPYDDTRVKLQELPDKPGSDYINASYIDGYSNPKVYIAAQGPHRNTLTDFWRLIWEQNCTRIVMLTNIVEMGKTKCLAYWSEENNLTVGDFNVAVISSSTRAHWIVRELQVTDKKTSACRCFHQFHFTQWPDHWIPDETPFAEFLWMVRAAANSPDDPLLVHCSAGIGRSGTYIAVDYLLDQALAEDKVDVFGFVSKMRDQRKGMIQTKEQYECVYTTLQEALEFGNTTNEIQEFCQNRNEKRTFKMGCMEPTQLIQILNINREMSRNEARFKGRVYVDGRTDIVAVEVESHLSMKGYLLTEAPSVTTASLFWKLIDQQESSTVIVLQDSHQSLSSYVPSPGDSLNLNPVHVTCLTENTIKPGIVLRNVNIQIEDLPPAPVHVYIMKQVPDDSHSMLLDLLEQVDLQTSGNASQPVAVIYSASGRKRGAMLCVLSNIVQGIKYDKTVEIYNNMRVMTHCMDQDITQDDVALCYEIASESIESQSIYANV